MHGEKRFAGSGCSCQIDNESFEGKGRWDLFWLILVALLFLLLLLLCLPLRLRVNLDFKSNRCQATAALGWAFWRLWQWPVAPAPAQKVQETQAKSHGSNKADQSLSSGKNNLPGRANAAQKGHSPGFRTADLRFWWELWQKHWRSVIHLVHWQFGGDLQLELEDAALAGWLYAAAGSTSLPPPSLRLEVIFGQVNRLQGRAGLTLRIYPIAVLRLLLRLFADPAIRRKIWAKIKRKGDKSGGRS